MKNVGWILTIIASVWFLYLGFVAKGSDSCLLFGISIIMASLARIEARQ